MSIIMTNVVLILKKNKKNIELFIETYMCAVCVKDLQGAMMIGQTGRKVAEIGRNCNVAQNSQGLVELA